MCQWKKYEGVSKGFRTESITKNTLIFSITLREATQRVMATKINRLAHKIAIQLHRVAESCTICSSRSRRPVRNFWIHSHIMPVVILVKGFGCKQRYKLNSRLTVTRFIYEHLTVYVHTSVYIHKHMCTYMYTRRLKLTKMR